MTTPTNPEPQSVEEVLLAVRDWGEGLSKQEFDDDPLPGMSPKEALSAIERIYERRFEEVLDGEVRFPEVMEYVRLLEDSGENRDPIFEAGYHQAIDQIRTNWNKLKGGK